MDVSSRLLLDRRFLGDVVEVTNMSEVIGSNPHGCDNGALTDRFGVLIQGLLAVIAFSTLMCKPPLTPPSHPPHQLTTGTKL